MQISKYNNQIKISELGFQLELNPAKLLNVLMKDSTQQFIIDSFIKRFNEVLLPEFKKIHEKIQLEYKEFKTDLFDNLKTNKNEFIYEYACIIRDLYPIIGDPLEELITENKDIIITINRIYSYCTLYGYKSSETTKF